MTIYQPVYDFKVGQKTYPYTLNKLIDNNLDSTLIKDLMRASSQRDFVALLRHPLPLPWGPLQEERHEAELLFLYIRKAL